MRHTVEPRRDRTKVVGVVLALGILTVAETSCSAQGIFVNETCVSPRTVSPVIEGDPSAKTVNGRRVWHTAVEAAVSDMPSGVKGVTVSYRAANTPEWTDTSKPIDPSVAGRVVLLVGNGDVVFSEQFEAKQGSPACDTAPKVTFSDPMPISSLRGDVVYPEW